MSCPPDLGDHRRPVAIITGAWKGIGAGFAFAFLVVRLITYFDRQAAFADLGLAQQAMSQQNVATMRALADLWDAGERSPSAIAEHLDPAVELESPFSSVVGVAYRGHAGIEQRTRDIDEQFSEWRLSLEDERDLDDRVIAIGTATGRGRVNGIVIEFAAALVASFARDGKITRLRIFQDINEALEAVGLAG